MKVIIDKVQNGLIPYGPGVGTQALSIHFKEVEGDFDYKAPEPKEGEENREYSNEEIIRRGLINDMTDKLHAEGLDADYAKFFFGVKYFYFVGDCVADPKYRDIFTTLIKFLYVTSYQIQKQEYEKAGVPEEEAKQRIKKCLVNLVTAPKYYTAKEEFYKLFDFVIVKMPFEGDVDTGAIVELEKTAAAIEIIEFTDDFENEKKVVEDKYKSKNALTINEKIFVVDKSEKLGDKIAEYAINNDYTIAKQTGYSKAIQLDY